MLRWDSKQLRLRAGRYASISRAEWRARPAAWSREESRRNRGIVAEENSFADYLWRDFRKLMRHNPRAFFDRDDFIDGHVGQLFHQSGGPGNFQRIDLGAFAQPEENAWIARRHIAHSALGLLDARNSFRRQLQRSADAVAI